MNTPEQQREHSSSEHREGTEWLERETANAEVMIDCSERKEEAEGAVAMVNKAIRKLGLPNVAMPRITVRFEPSPEGEPNAGRTRVRSDGTIEVVYDNAFATEDGEREFLTLQGMSEYPGFRQTLAHEVGHVAMWSITEMPRQPATRLLDEGWARLVEEAGKDDSTLEAVSEGAKRALREGLKNEPALYERCLDFRRAIAQGEYLNAAEYETGSAFLFWIRERFGSPALVRLLQLGIGAARRKDDAYDSFDPALVDRDVHGKKAHNSYVALQKKVAMEEILAEQIEEKALTWEGEQCERAILDVAGMNTLPEVQQKFVEWVQHS